MPINEQEFHPYLKIGEAITASRMIVGTFPIYPLTRPGRPLKDLMRQQRSDMLFFYGSSVNSFWSYYQQYIDPTIILRNNKSILSSLVNNKIAISDVIKEAQRNNVSPLDGNLKGIVWNKPLAVLIDAKINKIICTSKSASGAMGWLVHKILLPAGFTIDSQASRNLHQIIIGAIPNSNPTVSNIAFVLKKQARTVSIVSIPSPAGRGLRSLKHFGYLKGIHTTRSYLNTYLQLVFNWF